MKLVNGLLNAWQRSTCSHRWIRARWGDGSYGMRCANCMKPYPRTWDDLIEGPRAESGSGSAKLARAVEAEFTPLRRVA